MTHERAAAALRIERAVDPAYAAGIKPIEVGGRDGIEAVSKAVLQALSSLCGKPLNLITFSDSPNSSDVGRRPQSTALRFRGF